MWLTMWFGHTFLELYAYFIIYSFLGWAMESAFVSFHTKKWVNRGFVNGPLCPIYGTGALLILLVLHPAAQSIPLTFLGGFLIATAVEYLIGAAMEKLFHATWWDYREKPFNIKGRVCLERSVEWGILTVFVIRVIQPAVAGFTAAIPRAWGELAATAILAYLAVDTTITVLHVLRFNEKLETLSEAHAVLREKLESTKLYGTRQEIITHFEAMPAVEMLREWKERMAEEDEKLAELREEERLRLEYRMNEIKEKMESRVNALHHSTLVERRLLAAYPGLRSKRFDEELKALKREWKEKKEQKKQKGVSK